MTKDSPRKLNFPLKSEAIREAYFKEILMNTKQDIQLLLNNDDSHHEQDVADMILKAKHLECVVAFAKMSGLKLILENLKKCLVNGLTARFVVGLNFCQSEPEVLKQLLKLSKKHQLKLYLSDDADTDTFHPKIYAVTLEIGSKVIVGSANLTSGGLRSNYEASTLINDSGNSLMQSVQTYIDGLIENNILVPVTSERIETYERRYLINKAWQKITKRRIQKAIKNSGPKSDIYLKTLQEYLQDMKENTSDEGFQLAIASRKANLKAAVKKIFELSTNINLDASSFLAHYEELIGFFHSGGLHRSKREIAKHAKRFQTALAEITLSSKLPPYAAYKLMHEHFVYINGAGVNVITEILHALDNKAYPVMNQNAVNGLKLANIDQFPTMPSKASVKAEHYASFCEQADKLRKDLRLANFTELDALFNYAYWQDEEEEKKEDNE